MDSSADDGNESRGPTREAAHLTHPVRVEFRASDPDRLVEALAPVVEEISIRSLRASGFDARLRLAPLPRVVLFTVSLSPAQVLQPAPRGFTGITVPLSGTFDVRECGRAQTFSTGAFHLARSREPFDLRTIGGSRVLVAHLDNALLEEHAWSLGAPGGWSDRIATAHASEEPEWASVLGLLRYVWHELQREGSALHAPFVAGEVEDTIASMVVAAALCEPSPRSETPAHLRRAEEFLTAHVAAPVSLAEVVRAAGVSSRTLSRAFRSRHGVGVMGFLRQRRLEAARGALQMAEPESTSVTEVALRYGLGNLGRFAAEYRKAFGEYPSATLRARG
jgi:AraC-like DNA-binding protein